MKVAHRLLVSADDYLPGENKCRKNTETLLNDGKNVGVEVNSEKTMLSSCFVTRMRDKVRCMKMGNKSCENVWGN